jgi:hypothetical protein
MLRNMIDRVWAPYDQLLPIYRYHYALTLYVKQVNADLSEVWITGLTLPPAYYVLLLSSDLEA